MRNKVIEMSEARLISICMITYNHEQYIAEAIESILMQMTNFNIEIVIGEDCSTDNTKIICEQYASEHPGIIRLLPSVENLGVSKNFYRTLRACNGEYIAICEGDDYWTDHLKLKKQADILDADKTLSIVSANADYLVEGSIVKAEKTNRSSTETAGHFYAMEGLVDEWKCQTLTVMFRAEKADFEKLKSYSILYDTMLFYELLKNGRGYYLNETVGVYRHHSEGAWHGKTGSQKMKFVITQFYEIWRKNKKDRIIKNKVQQSMLDYLRGVTFFSNPEPTYYLSVIVKYLRVTKDYKYLKLLFINHVRHLRSN